MTHNLSQLMFHHREKSARLTERKVLMWLLTDRPQRCPFSPCRSLGLNKCILTSTYNLTSSTICTWNYFQEFKRNSKMFSFNPFFHWKKNPQGQLNVLCFLKINMKSFYESVYAKHRFWICSDARKSVVSKQSKQWYLIVLLCVRMWWEPEAEVMKIGLWGNKIKKKHFFPLILNSPAFVMCLHFWGTLPTRLSLMLFHLKSLQGYTVCVVV